MGHALLREDSGFHRYQVVEAAVRQHGNFAGTPAAAHLLIAAARFHAAHTPTVRALDQTCCIPLRLGRDENLHEVIEA